MDGLKIEHKERESNYELLRLVAMSFIVLYHILFFFISPIDNSPLYKALYLPLHTGVICFVLISGFYHIKPSVKGFIKLISPLIVFYVPLTIFELAIGRGGVKDLLFFSQSPYWFIRTYFYLYLLAPLLNSFLKNSYRRIYLLVVLGFISVYMGTMQDTSLLDGKNLALFMFLYVVGDSINFYSGILAKIKTTYVILSYIILNILIVLAYYHLDGTSLEILIWLSAYPYCSPVLIINAVLLFIIFGRMHIRSKVINSLASSVFTIYVLHHQHFILYTLIGAIALKIYHFFTTPASIICGLFLFTVIILMACIIVDKLFNPLWRFLHKIGEIGDQKLDVLLKTINGVKY